MLHTFAIEKTEIRTVGVKQSKVNELPCPLHDTGVVWTSLKSKYFLSESDFQIDLSQSKGMKGFKVLIFPSLMLVVLAETETHKLVSKNVDLSLTGKDALNHVKRQEEAGKVTALGDLSSLATGVENMPNCSLPSLSNSTLCKDDTESYGSILNKMAENKGMLWRTLCVSLGVTGIVIIYFVVRAVRLRRRRSKSRKYGIITQHDQGDVEMEPLGDGNDEDDDYTVFEMNGKR